MLYFRKSSALLSVVALFFIFSFHFRSDLVAKECLCLLSVCFICELIDSGLGMGYGTILTPVLILFGFEPSKIVPTILFSELLSGFTAAFFHNEIKNVDLSLKGKDFRPALLLAGGSVVGVFVGVSFAVSLPKEVLKLSIGGIILLSGLLVIILSKKTIAYKSWKMLLLSMVASFNKSVSGGGYGPLVTSGQILSGVKGKSAVGITSFAEAFTCLVAVGAFLAKGGYINWPIFIPMITGALISVPFSVFAINKTKEDRLKIIIGVLTFFMGGLIIWKTIS
jgi:uncharacterized membrane protein YfcA